jgi:hypothetical protein
MFFKSLYRVVGAARVKTAVIPQQRTDKQLVTTNQEDED